jgi:hypothetical protein
VPVVVSPFVVAGAVIVLSARDLGLPALLRPTSVDAGSIALPVADRYLDFAPTAPVLLGVWAAATLLLVELIRGHFHRITSSEGRQSTVDHRSSSSALGS